MMKLEKKMTHRMATYVGQTVATQFGRFPPEADGVFPVVPDAEIAEWRDRLNTEFGIGMGMLKVVDDPFVAA